MNRAYRRSLIRRLGKNKAALLFRTQTAESMTHPGRVPKDWYHRHKPTTYRSGDVTVTIPGDVGLRP